MTDKPEIERHFTVHTFCDPGESRKSKVHAYTVWANPAWPGCRTYLVVARTGREAKQRAVEMRLADERKEEQR